MRSDRTEGVILRYYPLTESSLIVTWYTRDFGKLKTVAKGARRLKGLFVGQIDLFYQSTILFLQSKRSDLHILQDCYLEDPHVSLRNSYQAFVTASYICELVDLASSSEDANASVFKLLVQMLKVLPQQRHDALVIWFELHLLAAIGLQPRWERINGVNRVLSSLASSSVEGASRIRLTKLQVNEARYTLSNFWDSHIGKAPRSKLLFEQISSVTEQIKKYSGVNLHNPL